MTIRCLLLAACLAAAPLWAHDDLHAQIDRAGEEIAADPGNASLYLRRAELLRLHGELDLAQADIATAGRLDPAVAGLDRALARVLMDLDDHRAARAALDRHLARAGDDGEALAARAACAERLGDAPAARADLDAALRLLHQPDPDLVCRLAMLLQAEGRTDEALARLEQAAGAAGAVPAFTETALAIERASGRIDAALARLDRLAAGPGQARWLVRRGDVLLEAGRKPEAIAAYRAAAAALDALPPARRAVPVNEALATQVAAMLATLTGKP